MKAKILLYDIETAPNISYTWGKYEQDVIKFQEEWYMLCFAWKWLDDKRVNVLGLPDFKLYDREPKNDRELARELHKLFSEADVIIAHNGDSFDQKMSNARFLYHQLPPPEPYKQLDTKKIAKRYFRFNSNKLDDIGGLLEIGHKIETGGFDLWLGCMTGDKKAWKKMMAYNKQDVVLLEDVYYRLRPWITNHPSISLLTDEVDGCPKCGAAELASRGFAYTKVSKVRRFQCGNCGGWSQQRTQERTATRYV